MIDHKPQVLLLFSSSHLGGAERSLSRMALASDSIGYKLATVTGEGEWSTWIRREGGVPIIFGSGTSPFYSSLFGFYQLIKYLRANPVDVIYVSGLRVSLGLRLLKPILPRSLLVHAVRWNPNTANMLDRIFRFVERHFRSSIELYITNSLATKKTLSQLCQIEPTRIVTIYNGIDVIDDIFKASSDSRRSILTVANLSSRKGYIEYLAIIKLVLKKYPNERFVFAGRDDLNGLIQKSITTTGLENSVSYLGFVRDVLPLLRTAKIFVLPSLWGEGCPTSILEAMSLRLPIIAHAIDGIPELVNHGSDGFLCQVHTQEMASAIIKLLDNPDLGESMGKTGHAKVSNSFSLSKCVDLHTNAFIEICENNKCAE